MVILSTIRSHCLFEVRILNTIEMSVLIFNMPESHQLPSKKAKIFFNRSLREKIFGCAAQDRELRSQTLLLFTILC